VLLGLGINQSFALTRFNHVWVTTPERGITISARQQVGSGGTIHHQVLTIDSKFNFGVLSIFARRNDQAAQVPCLLSRQDILASLSFHVGIARMAGLGHLGSML
jgi:hypothetical protein